MQLARILITPAALALGSVVGAQTTPPIPTLPFARTMDLLVCDTSFDGVWRLSDFNQDGDYNDPGEVAAYYDETIGTVLLGNPSCIACSSDGYAFVGDSTGDTIVRLRDANGDGDAHDPGEYTVFFDSTTNAAGITLATPGGLSVDVLGRVFVATANSSSTGLDQIVMLQDLNGDGDANDAQEAIDYHTVPGSVAVGDSIPTEVLAAYGPTGAPELFYAEGGATGVIAKGVYRLADGNGDGDCNDPGERSTYWDTSAIGATSPFHYGMAVDQAGRFYLTDHSSNETVWSAFDANNNGVIDAGEASAFYVSPASTWWDVLVREDGALLLCEDQTPDRLTLLQDLNSDGDAMDPGEAVDVYDDTLAANGMVRPRAAAWLRAPLLVAAPPSVQIGNATTLQASTNRPGELVAVFLSTSVIAPVPLPPFGNVEIDPLAAVSIGFGLSNPSNGLFSVLLPVPSNPALVGTFAAQALCGDAYRLFLSTPAVLTVTP